MTPAIALELMKRHPGLIMSTSLETDMFAPEEWGAIMSPPDNGISLHRYMLWRIFDPSLRLLIVVMLNPSTATHQEGDRTVDGLVRRARRLGYGGILVVNCFAFRAREPRDMKMAADPVGAANDDAITIAVARQDVLCAWGVNANYNNRNERVKCLIRKSGGMPHYLRLCANGEPEHPLYIPSALEPRPWAGM